jgi:hypothetical protein
MAFSNVIAVSIMITTDSGVQVFCGFPLTGRARFTLPLYPALPS